MPPTSVRARLALLTGLVAAIMLTGCSTSAIPAPASAPASASPSTSPSEVRNAPITARAIAALMLDHLPGDYSSGNPAWVYEDSPKGFVGAELRYHPGAGDDGDLVRVTMWPTDRPLTCGTRPHCVVLDDAGDDQVFLSWELEEPEEDPGLFSVWINRPGETVHGLVAGPVLQDDPRNQPGDVTVDLLRQVVTDERLRLLTTPSAMDAGDRVKRWHKQ